MLQSPKPTAQAATVHAPREQPAVAFRSEHARPHIPQWFGVVARSVSQPFAAFPSQSPKLPVQVYRHVPISQFTIEFGRATQGEPHAPQADRLVRVSVSQPFEASPSQFANGATQLPRAHTPARQTGVAFGIEQRVSQAPQLETFI